MKKTMQAFMTVAVCSVALLAAASASAQPTDAKAALVERKFKMADKDGDGKLTRAEADAGMPLVARNFDRIDTDKKGYLTLDQIRTAVGNR